MIALSCGMTYDITNIALFKPNGCGYQMDSDFYNSNFAGQPVKHK